MGFTERMRIEKQEHPAVLSLKGKIELGGEHGKPKYKIEITKNELKSFKK